MTSRYLSIDISSRLTRAWLFDNKSGSYRLIEHVQAPVQADPGQGLTAAIDQMTRQLEAKTGLNLSSRPGRFQIETDQHASDLKGVGVTFAIGKPIRVVLVGLSEKFSLEPLRRLVRFFNTEIVLEINLQNEPNVSAQLEKLTNTAFDLLILAGGINNGPEKALRAMISNLRLLVQLRGAANRPQIVYAGNQTLADYVKMEVDAGDDLHIAGNIQPESGREDLSYASKALLNAIGRLRSKQFPELEQLSQQPGMNLLPAEFARARIGQWLEQTQTNGKGVLQIHLEAGSGHAIAIQDGKRMGIWQNSCVDDEIITQVQAQSDQPVDRATVAAYLHNRELHPGFVPATIEEMSMELAWDCLRVQRLLREMATLYEDFSYDPNLGLVDNFEPVLLSGESFERLPTVRHSFMVAQNGILPHGITTLVGDDRQLVAALGALADFDPLLAAQIVDSDVFTGLATVVNVDSPLDAGSRVLELEVDVDYGERREHYQVYQAELKRIETVPGQSLRVYLAPEADSDVGMGMRGLGGWLNASPSSLGLVVDARGRPYFLPVDDPGAQTARREWMWNLQT